MAAVVVVALVASGCVGLAQKERELTFRPVREAAGWYSGMPEAMQDIYLPVANGTTTENIHAWWWPAEDSDAPAVFYLHGARWNLTGHLNRIAQLRSFGFSVFAIDYRGFGKSDGELPSEDSVYEDARVGWAWLAARQPDPSRRYIYGHSLGGAVAVELAFELAGGGPGAQGLIVEATFTSLADMAAELTKGWLPAGLVLTQKFDSLGKIGQVRMPVLVVHGASDRFVPSRFSEALYAAAPTPKKLLLVENGSHNNSMWIGNGEYQEALVELFGPQPAGPGRPRRPRSLPSHRRARARRSTGRDASAFHPLMPAKPNEAPKNAAEPFGISRYGQKRRANWENELGTGVGGKHSMKRLALAIVAVLAVTLACDMAWAQRGGSGGGPGGGPGAGRGGAPSGGGGAWRGGAPGGGWQGGAAMGSGRGSWQGGAPTGSGRGSWQGSPSRGTWSGGYWGHGNQGSASGKGWYGSGRGWYGSGRGWYGSGRGWYGYGRGWYGYGDGWYGGWYGPGVGIYLGSPGYWGVGWPWAYGYPYAYSAYYPYPVDGPTDPPVYVQQDATPTVNYWYYCTEPAGYYPYVQRCSKAWMPVVPQSVPDSADTPAAPQ